MIGIIRKVGAEFNFWERLAFIVVLLGCMMPFVLQYLYFNTIALLEIKTQGQLGPVSDWLSGIITPCIALASFILLCRTYYSQKEELTLTRVIMNQQKFETTFFNLLNLFNDHAKNINYKIVSAQGKNEYNGQEYFHQMHFQIFESKCKNKEKKDLTLLMSLEQHIGSYVEVLRCLITLIDTSDGIEKGTFIGILKATMSAEAKYAVYYFLSESLIEENKGLYELITKYDICDMVRNAEFAKRFNEKMQSMKDEKDTPPLS